MSYCRWSSDSYRCDVYVYASSSGVEVHVAATRPVLPDDVRAPSIDLVLDGRTEEYLAAHTAFQAAYDDAPTVPVPERFAGQSHTLDGPGEAADLLTRMRKEGVNVPADVIDVLREEQAELNDAGQRP